MAEPGQDLDLSQCSLAVGLMLERRDLLDSHLRVGLLVHGRAVEWYREIMD